MMRIASSTVISVPPATVLAFLIEWQNHWLLSGPKIELLELAESPEGLWVVWSRCEVRSGCNGRLGPGSTASASRGS